MEEPLLDQENEDRRVGGRTKGEEISLEVSHVENVFFVRSR